MNMLLGVLNSIEIVFGLQIDELKAKLGEDDVAVSMISVKEESKASEEPPTLIYKDGSSDSDSSAIVTGYQMTISDSIPFSNLDSGSYQDKCTAFGTQIYPFLKMEECDEIVGGDDACISLFIEEQAPSLPWCYGVDHWSLS